MTLGIKQRQQTALAVKRHQVIAAANVGTADKNLRYRATLGKLRHFVPLANNLVNTDFDEVSHAALGEQLFG